VNLTAFDGVCCGLAIESCGSEWFQSALAATFSTTLAWSYSIFAVRDLVPQLGALNGSCVPFLVCFLVQKSVATPIIFNAWRQLRAPFAELLDTAPAPQLEGEVRSVASTVSGVIGLQKFQVILPFLTVICRP
jgi:hypothetical protein